MGWLPHPHTSSETELLTLFFISRRVNPHLEDSVQAVPVQPSLLPGWPWCDMEHAAQMQPQLGLPLLGEVGNGL